MPLTFRGRRCETGISLEDFKDTKHWRIKLIHDKWLNMNKQVAYRRIVKITNTSTQIKLGKYLDILKNNGLIE